MWNTSLSHQIFTTHLHAHYSAPDGFNFEQNGKNDLTDANKAVKAKHLVDIGRQWNKDYGSKGHVLITFGDDFQYKNAGNWFKNFDILIEEVNKQFPDVHLQYSSPQCYLKAILDSKPKLEVRSQDYHPYWTGYYSSRPVVKYLDRYVNNLLQAAKQLEVVAEVGNLQALIYEGKNQMGVLQHHDAVSGTSPSNVMVDYKEREVNAIRAIKSAMTQGLAKLTHKTPLPAAMSHDGPNIYISSNVSDFTDHLGHAAFVATIYNPLAQSVKSWVRIPVTEEYGYKVIDAVDGTEVKNVNLVPIADKVRSLVGHHKQITHELIFEATLPALGYTKYLASHQATKLVENRSDLDKNADGDLVLKGMNFELVVSHLTGRIVKITKGGSHTHRVEQTFAYYNGKSDAYEFCPHGPATDLQAAKAPLKVEHSGKYAGYSEITAKGSDWLEQTIRVYEDRDYVELDFTVGPLSEVAHESMEVIVRFDTDLKSNKLFYTDENGRQTMQRLRSAEVRECHGQQQNITYNYYPSTTLAALRDEETHTAELLLIPDRSVGVSSLKDGELEVMIHRRQFPEDGLWIIPDDKDVDGKGITTRGKILLFLNDKAVADSEADVNRQASREIFMQPIVALNPVDDVEAYRKDHNLHFSALKAPLPDNIHLLTLETWGPVQNNEVLVRFENFYQPTDVSKLAAEAKLSLDNLFAGLQIESVQQTNLAGGHPIALTSKEISIRPGEIETLILKVKRTLTNTACSFKWEKLTAANKLPDHAILAGHEVAANSPLYICRHKDHDLIPGKFNDILHCHVTYGGGEAEFNDAEVEILTAAEGSYYQWAPRHGGDPFPETAFVAGTRADGLPLYVGRCAKNGLQVGKIDEYFYYGFSGGEHRDCLDHEILTC